MKKTCLALFLLTVVLLGCSNSKIAITNIDFPYQSCGVAGLVNEQLYASTNVEAGFVNAVVRYDPKTKNSDVIYKSKYDLVDITCNEKWLLWETDSKLYVQNMRTKKRKVVAQSRMYYGFALHGDHAAWVDKNEAEVYKVVIHNLETNRRVTLGRINTPGLYNNFLHMFDNKLVWTDIKGEVGFYYIYDLEKKNVNTYRLNSKDYPYPGYAKLAGDKIYSINFKDTHDWTLQQFGYYSLDSEKFIPLVEGTYINGFRAHGKHVAVMDSNNDLVIYTVKGKTISKKNVRESLKMGIDGLEFSHDGTLIAFNNQDNANAKLFIIRF